MSYPPEPWRLCGRLSVSLWWVPARQLPVVPDGTVPVRVGGSGLIGTAFVEYGPGSVLEYNELLVAVLVRRGARLRACVSQIWVDSGSSRQGGRELWSIPKETATFEISTGVLRAQGIATAATTEGVTVPGTWPFRYKIAQQAPGGLQESRVRLRSRLTVRRATWQVDRPGPLDWLDGHRPFLSLGVDDFDMRFGSC